MDSNILINVRYKVLNMIIKYVHVSVVKNSRILVVTSRLFLLTPFPGFTSYHNMFNRKNTFSFVIIIFFVNILYSASPVCWSLTEAILIHENIYLLSYIFSYFYLDSLTMFVLYLIEVFSTFWNEVLFFH